MAKSNNPMPLFLILMGTLAFSLSTLPKGEDGGHFMVTSLSSEFASDCDNMGKSISGGANSGSCVINPVDSGDDRARVSGRVDVQLVDVKSRDPHDFNKTVTRKEWQRTTEIVCEGKDCPREPIKITTNYDQDDYKKLSRMDDFQTGAQKMVRLMKIAAEDSKKERADQDRRYRCDADRDGVQLNSRDQMRCRIARVGKMDEEAAADYYEQYILPKIQNMVGSTDPRIQRQGMELLRQLNAAGVGGDFVKQSVADLARFGQYKFQSEQQKIALMSMNPNDPRLPGMVQQMRLAQFQADSYFHSRGIYVDNEGWGTGPNGFDYGMTLMNNLNNFQTMLDNNYANMLSKYQNMFQTPTSWQQQQQMVNQQAPTPNGPWPAAPPPSQQLQQLQNQQRTGMNQQQPLPAGLNQQQQQPFQQQQGPQQQQPQYQGTWNPSGPMTPAPQQNATASAKPVLRPISKR